MFDGYGLAGPAEQGQLGPVIWISPVFETVVVDAAAEAVPGSIWLTANGDVANHRRPRPAFFPFPQKLPMCILGCAPIILHEGDDVRYRCL